MSAARLPARGAGPLIIAAALTSLALVVLLPLAMVFAEAFRQGLPGYLAAFDEPDTWAAVRLTLLIAVISVPLNAVFGLAAAWSIAKFEFRGKSLLVTLIDLPFTVSPVVSGLVWVLLFGANGWFWPLLQDLGIRIIFNTTGVILATVLVTLPFVARELIPLMQQQGAEAEDEGSLGERGRKRPCAFEGFLEELEARHAPLGRGPTSFNAGSRSES